MIGALLRWLRPKRPGKPFDELPDELVCAILARQELDQSDRREWKGQAGQSRRHCSSRQLESCRRPPSPAPVSQSCCPSSTGWSPVPWSAAAGTA